MSEKRKKTESILLDIEGKVTSIFIYNSLLWPDTDYAPDLYRLKINGKWYAPNDRYTFLSREQIMMVVSKLFAGVTLFEAEPTPYYPKNADVRVYFEDNIHRGTVQSPPHREIDGRWYAWVWGAFGTAKVLCDNLKLVRVRPWP